MFLRSFLAELRRRKVIQVAAIYGAVAWGVTEVTVTVTEQLFLPQWLSTLAVIGFVVGFPVAMFLAWIFDITSEGIQRTSVSSRRGKASIAASMILLVAGTAGLFFLIRPTLQSQAQPVTAISIAANSVAVLPFDDSGLDPEDAYLGDGLSDELRDQLGRISGIRIAARSSSIAARDQKLNALAISSSLGVANLLEGSLRRQGNSLRISVQLIEGSSGLALWSEVFERGPRELLGVQQAIVEKVASLVLPDIEIEMAEPATLDATANELMLLARHYDQQVRERQEVDTETLLDAVRLYREATEADPTSALAHSRLASALLYLGDIDAAEAPIFKALSLDPNLSEVQNTLGEFYWARGMPEAITAFERAVELNPNNPDALTNFASARQLGYVQFEADLAEYYRRALEFDPLSLSRHAALGEFLGKFGRVDEVHSVIERIERLFNSAASYRAIAWLKELIGELDQAIAWTIRARDLEPDNRDHVEKLAALYAAIADFETALALEPEPGIGLLFRMRRYDELIDTAEFLMIEHPEDIDIRYLLAFAYQATGQFESAIHILSSTGQPDIVINDHARSVPDIEAMFTLINALAGVGESDAVEAAISLAQWNADGPWHGDIYWTALYKGCVLAVLERDEEALQLLARMKETSRIPWDPALRDQFCLLRYSEEPIYLDILHHFDQKRAELRARLPSTLAEFGVEL